MLEQGHVDKVEKIKSFVGLLLNSSQVIEMLGSSDS